MLLRVLAAVAAGLLILASGAEAANEPKAAAPAAGQTMTVEQVRDFAQRLMREVWEPYAYQKVGEFYQPDMVGHHRDQTLTFQDVVNRLAWDDLRFKDSNYDIRDIVASPDNKFAIRFIYTCTLVKTGEPFRTEVIYFYHLRDGKIAEWWLLSSYDFDYKEKP